MRLDFAFPERNKGFVEVLQNSIFHIRIAPEHRFDSYSALSRYGYLEKLPPEEDLSVSRTGELLEICAPGGTLTLREKEGTLLLVSASGKTLLSQKSLTFSGKTVSSVFTVDPGEDFAGFGDVSREHYFHRGRKISCWIRNVKSYICVPFFMSTAGYGLLLDSTHKSVFDMDSTSCNEVRITEGSGVWDVYLFTGNDFKEMLQKYTSLTGRPVMPPVWSFGLWHICNNLYNAKDVVEDAYRYRELGIPCDVIGLEPGWMEKSYDYSTEKKWDPVKFPLMLESFKFRKRTFLDAIKYGMGYHFELWLCDDYDLTYEEERRRGKDFKLEKEEVFMDTEEFDTRLGVNVRTDLITKPEESWFEHLKNFVDWGTDFFKTDGALQVNNHPGRVYGNKMTDEECHNFYPLMLMRQMWEGFAEHTNRRPLIFNPCGWTTFQKWASTWTGDTGGGATTLCGMFNTCFAGHGLTTNDMSANTVEGVHFGYLLPLSQINNYSSWKMPWLWGPKFMALHKFYSSLRSRLIPYLYSCMYRTTQNGIPFLLPPAMEFPQDRKCRGLKNEHLLGPSLLVSSFTTEVYFPEGEWKDYWSGQYFAGKRNAVVPCPEDRGGGLFVRQGAIIPMGEVLQYRSEKELENMELYLYPGPQETAFAYYEDDGITFDYLKGEYALTEMTLQRTDPCVRFTLTPHAKSRVKHWSAVVALKKEPVKVLSGGKEVSFQWDDSRQEVRIPALESGITTIEL